jgi:hypothetical protein
MFQAQGLQVREVHLSSIGAAAIMERAAFEGVPVAGESAERMRRNGLHLVQLPEAEADRWIAALGVPTFDKVVWHGQATEWREFCSAPVGRQARPVMIDGVSQRLDSGALLLNGRGWSVEREDGPHLEVELQTEFRRVDSPRGPLARALRGEPEPPQIEATFRFNALIPPEHVLLVYADDPESLWGRPGSAGSRSVGPETAPPPTLGELLLAGGAPAPSTKPQICLLLMPRLPEGPTAGAAGPGDPAP